MNGLEHLIGTWYVTAGYFGIVLAMALESCGIPLPSELVMPLAGVYATQYPDRFSLVGVTAAGALGCVIGSAVAYGIGFAGGRPLLLRYGRYLLISQADADRADQLFARYGSPVVFFARLLPVIRTYISLPAGISRMPFVRFCLYSGLGSLPWCFLLAWAGSKLGEQNSQLATLFHGLDGVIGVVLVVALGWYIWHHLHRDRIAREQQLAQSQSLQPWPNLSADSANRWSLAPQAMSMSNATHSAEGAEGGLSGTRRLELIAQLDTVAMPRVPPAPNVFQQHQLPAGAPGVLTVQEGHGLTSEQQFILGQPVVTIGRHHKRDIVVDDVLVSRLHATIRANPNPRNLLGANATIGQRYVLRDEQSANHTFVNGQQVSEYLLHEGDHIRIGQVVFLFHYR